MNAFPEFTGTLSFSVTGPGVSIDPATGAVSIAADRLQDGIEVAVTAAESDGTTTGRFRLTFETGATPPRLLTAPALAGPAVIGTPAEVDPGSWEAASSLALQWCRDGADIAGADADAYVPVAADDRCRLSCRVTATNAAGSTTAETDAVEIVHAAPRVVAALPDLDLELDTGTAVAEAASAFAGAALAYAVEGAGATIDRATGRLGLPTDALVTGAEVTVTAGNSGGSATAAFRVSVRGVAPAATVEPGLAGSGKVGAEIRVEPGSWSGKPAPTLALQWRRDGADIAGATAAAYVPVAADDRARLTCRVTATNAAGTAAAETAAREVTRVAPVASGTLADVTLVQGAAAGSVDAAAAFTGAALAYAVAGAGATIDPATGRVGLPTDALVTGAEVTVTARNSGGSATAVFRVTVRAASTLPPPAAVGRIADVVFPLDDAVHSVSTQSAFSGSELVYALETAPAGATIHAGSGLVEFAATAALDAAPVTVRASNAAGAATQSFAVTIGALATVFDAAEKLDELRFIHEGAAPSWTLKGGLQARLEPATTGRVHGDWRFGGGDGLYRALVRWNSTNTGVNGSSPFLFGARIAQSGADFSGLYAEVTKVSGTERQLRLLQYTGAGSATTLLASTSSAWVWYTWYWFEMEVAGASVKARLYAEDAAAPDWQLQATTTHTAAGLFGPSAFPIGGVGPFLDIKQLDYVPGAVATPSAASDGDWALNQITEQK